MPTELRGGALRPLNVLAIAVAAISPTTSVFLVYGTGLASAGTGVIWAFVIGAVIALAMAFCYAEAGSVFPSAGGAYTIVRKALGPVFGGVSTILFLVLGIVVTASILVASATYLVQLTGANVPVNWVAFGMMVLVTVLSLEKISPTSWVTGLMLVLELAVILVFTGFCFGHVSLGSDPFAHPLVPLSASRGPAPLVAVGASGMIAAIVPALFAFNGYDWPLYFAEESRGSRRAIPRAVMLAALISVVVEVLAVIAATYAIKDLAGTAASAAPLSDIATRVMGSTGSKILLIGVVIAMFDTGLAGNLAYARIYYAAARDQMWPGPLNSFFGHLSRRTQVPVWGFAVLFAGNAVLCIFSSLNNLITFTGVVIVIIYLMVAVSAVVCRVRERGRSSGEDGTFRMPLWPVPPLIAIAGVIVALTQQNAKDLYIAFGVAAVSLIGYFATRRRLKDA